MEHGVPWGALSGGPLREGLVSLESRMDLSPPGSRPWDAYVGLRMIHMKVKLTPECETLEVRLSHDTTIALVEELATIPQLAELREALLHTLREEPEDEGQRTERHHRKTVRGSRSLSFQR